MCHWVTAYVQHTHTHTQSIHTLLDKPKLEIGHSEINAFINGKSVVPQSDVLGGSNPNPLLRVALGTVLVTKSSR